MVCVCMCLIPRINYILRESEIQVGQITSEPIIRLYVNGLTFLYSVGPNRFCDGDKISLFYSSFSLVILRTLLVQYMTVVILTKRK